MPGLSDAAVQFPPAPVLVALGDLTGGEEELGPGPGFFSAEVARMQALAQGVKLTLE